MSFEHGTGSSRDARAASRLRVEGVWKRFGTTQALADVSLDIAAGEVHGLLGANGAGKSTLIRVLAGATAPDRGQVFVGGLPVTLASPADARHLGIGVIHQQLSLLPSLTVAENFMLKRAAEVPPRALFPSRQEPRLVARETLRQFELAVEPDARVDRLSFSQRQLVEIAIAVSSNVRVLIMDEPTSGLSAREQEALFEAVGRLVDSGVAIVYVSHRMNEIYRLCDRITVLREGRTVARFDRASLRPDAVVEAIVGTPLLALESQLAAAEAQPRRRENALVVENLRTSRLGGISFEVARGEILGLYGVVGSGVAELGEALFGACPSAGEVRLDGRLLGRGDPVRSRRAGITFVPADHRARGVVPLFSVRENVLLGRGTWRRQFVRRLTPALRRRVAEVVSSLRVKCRDVNQTVTELSGGNQQKVVFARGILDEPKVLVLEDPTQGIDVGAKVDMLEAIKQQRDRGAAVVFISSEVAEIVSIADRALVIRDGAVAGSLEGESLQEGRLVALAAGG